MDAPLRLARTLIRLTGADTRAFLQNLLTQDLDDLDASQLRYGALLTPQGKVLADMFIWAQQEGGVILDTAPERGEDLFRRLSMYKLRAKVQLEDVSARHAILAGDAPFANALQDPRLPALGWRALVASESAASPDQSRLYRQRQLALGVPDLAHDCAPDEVFALEALLEELNGVGFHKGCFVGQENVSRMKRRATTRKKFCPIAFEGEAPEFGAPVLAGEAEIGTVRSGRPGRAMALVRLDRALGAALHVGDRPVRLDPPPWLLLPAREPD